MNTDDGDDLEGRPEPFALSIDELPPLKEMRAFASTYIGGAELMRAADALEAAYRGFFTEAPTISADHFALLWFETGDRWGPVIGHNFSALFGEDWDRIRRAALALHRPREPGSLLQ